MVGFKHIEYEALAAVRKGQYQVLVEGELHNLSIDENGIADKTTRQAIADFLEKLPFDDDNKYNCDAFEQAVNWIHSDYSIVDFVISLINRYQEVRLFAQLYWLEKHGKSNPVWGDFLLEIPESDEDEQESDGE